jgi:hypothetical protein
MTDDPKRRDIARGEAKSKIYWGADVEEVLEHLRANHGIEGEEADAVVADAVKARRSAIRKKAAIGFGFAVIGLAGSITYFAIQGFVGFMVIGFGPILMGLLGLACLSMAGRSVYRLLTGEASGPV